VRRLHRLAFATANVGVSMSTPLAQLMGEPERGQRPTLRLQTGPVRASTYDAEALTSTSPSL